MKTIIACFISLMIVSQPLRAEVVGEEVTYKTATTTLKGYLAYDNAIRQRRPAVLVVHEWWGLNQYARRRARELAELGYTALAVDMYGDGKNTEHPDEASKFYKAVTNDMPEARARFMAAMEIISNHPTVDKSKIAAIGYCFGGGVVLEMARAGFDLDGVVSFHGSLGTSTPAAPGKVKAKMLVLNGAADPFVTAEHITAFKQEMNSAGVDYKFVNYPGAMHSFTNPDADTFARKFGMPLKYDADADALSWKEMQKFLVAIFK